MVCAGKSQKEKSQYGAIAKALNSSPRAVGQALKKNPFSPAVPCHRVVKSDGTIGGFMGKVTGSEITKKIFLLEKEGIKMKGGKILSKKFFFEW